MSPLGPLSVPLSQVGKIVILCLGETPIRRKMGWNSPPAGDVEIAEVLGTARLGIANLIGYPAKDPSGKFIFFTKIAHQVVHVKALNPMAVVGKAPHLVKYMKSCVVILIQTGGMMLQEPAVFVGPDHGHMSLNLPGPLCRGSDGRFPAFPDIVFS